jgi:hypothetical protein
MEEDPNRRPDRKRRREGGDLEEEAKNQQSSPNIPSMLAVNQSAASVDGIGAGTSVMNKRIHLKHRKCFCVGAGFFFKSCSGSNFFHIVRA